jgi:hypothetical protein
MLQSKKRQKSIIGRLTDPQKQLFDLLSAPNWEAKAPKINSEMAKLVDDRDATRISNIAKAWTRGWQGTVTLPLLVQFLSEGYQTEEHPGGFTIFMFYPSHIRKRTTKEIEASIRSALSERVGLTDDMVKQLAKRDWYLPMTVQDAITQIQTAKRFLDKLTTTDSIATQYLAHGEKTIHAYRLRFEEAIVVDPLYMVRYVHLLDSIFQAFLARFTEYLDEQYPVRAAAPELRKWMVTEIKDALRGLEYGQYPFLRLPGSLQLQQPDGKPPPAPAAQPPPIKPPPKQPKPANTANFGIQPDYWKIPPNKTFRGTWGRDNPQHQAALLALPQVPHHLTAKPVPLCLKFAVNGKCRGTCQRGHILYEAMTGTIEEACRRACQLAYS